MKQKDFDRLVISVKQAGAIRRGQLKPAQTTEFRPEDMGKIRTQTRNVFLSFSTEDKGLADLFRDQARDRQSDLVFRDYSIKKTFEHAWKTNAERLIRACSVTICLIGGTTHRSKAVDWEIRKSVELGKYIMAVFLEPTVPRVPPVLVALRAIYDSVYPPGGKRLAASLRPSARGQSTPTPVRLQPIVNRSNVAPLPWDIERIAGELNNGETG